MFRRLLRVALWTCLGVAVEVVAAPPVGDSPYRELERSPISGWPSFYKPLKISPRDQLFYAMGWCRTMHYRYQPSDRVVVDQLPETAHEGVVTAVSPEALLMMAKSTGQEFIVRVHPEATQLRVQGSADRAALQTGRWVKFVTTVDRAGRVVAPLTALALVSQRANELPPKFELEQETTIIGRVGRYAASTLVVTAQADRRRNLTLVLSDEAEISVDVHELSWATTDARCQVRGRLYQPDGEGARPEILATELDVALARPTAGPVAAH